MSLSFKCGIILERQWLVYLHVHLLIKTTDYECAKLNLLQYQHSCAYWLSSALEVFVLYTSPL